VAHSAAALSCTSTDARSASASSLAAARAASRSFNVASASSARCASAVAFFLSVSCSSRAALNASCNSSARHPRSPACCLALASCSVSVFASICVAWSSWPRACKRSFTSASSGANPSINLRRLFRCPVNADFRGLMRPSSSWILSLKSYLPAVVFARINDAYSSGSPRKRSKSSTNSTAGSTGRGGASCAAGGSLGGAAATAAALTEDPSSGFKVTPMLLVSGPRSGIAISVVASVVVLVTIPGEPSDVACRMATAQPACL